MAPFSHPSADIGRVQTVRKGILLGATGLLVMAFFLVGSRWPEGHDVHEGLERLGIGLILVCIVGRTWCVLYIGGRKNAAVVDQGPYSVCRNPLYVFSFLGAAGVGAQLGSVVLAVLVTAIVWIVFRVVVAREEQYLAARLGEPYRDYLDRVPRFLPRPSLWRNADSLEVRPALVMRTFVDACFFLVAVPVAELFEWLQDGGLIPVLLRVP